MSQFRVGDLQQARFQEEERADRVAALPALSTRLMSRTCRTSTTRGTFTDTNLLWCAPPDGQG